MPPIFTSLICPTLNRHGQINRYQCFVRRRSCDHLRMFSPVDGDVFIVGDAFYAWMNNDIVLLPVSTTQEWCV
jgi:hypothetical protein